MTDEQAKILSKYQQQISEIMKVVGDKLSDIIITCGECGKKKHLWRVYRCYMCGLYICEDCAPEHFGTGKRPRVEW